MKVSQGERERAVFRSRRMYQTDEQSNLATARDNGIKEGKAIQTVEIARNALRMNLPIADIAKLTGLSCEEIEGLRVEE